MPFANVEVSKLEVTKLLVRRARRSTELLRQRRVLLEPPPGSARLAQAPPAPPVPPAPPAAPKVSIEPLEQRLPGAMEQSVSPRERCDDLSETDDGQSGDGAAPTRPRACAHLHDRSSPPLDACVRSPTNPSCDRAADRVAEMPMDSNLGTARFVTDDQSNAPTAPLRTIRMEAGGRVVAEADLPPTACLQYLAHPGIGGNALITNVSA